MILGTLIFWVRNWSSFGSGGHAGSGTHSDPNPLVIVSVMVSPVVVFLIYYYYLKYSQRHKIIEWLGREKTPAFSEFAFREVQTLLALVMVKRDRYLLTVKYSLMQKHARKYFPDQKLDVEEIIDVYLDDKIPMTELIAWCNQNLSYAQKLETFGYVHEIAAIDGEMLDAEKEYLLYLIQKFSLKNEDIPEVIHERLFGNSKKSAGTSLPKFHYYYEILEVAVDATDKEVKESYRRLAKQFHPDSHPHLSSEEKKLLSEKFQRVQEAYDRIISN